MASPEQHPATPTPPSSGPAHPSRTGRASVGQWVEGARPRTLPAAIAPVLAGTGVAAWAGAADLVPALLAAVVALALQVGVNYANDYSDGIRGTDADRVGPLRLVGSGLAAPSTVKAAAFAAFGVAAVAGLVLAVATAWWLVVVGVVCILAAWFYTGGAKPYGYAGLGEVVVFVFFGLVAVVGTTYVQTAGTPGATGRALLPSFLAACATGALACAILVANNLRDIPGDEVVGKRTLAVRLQDPRTRLLYAALVVAAFVLLVPLALTSSWWVLVALVAVPPARSAVAVVRGGARGPGLIPVLALTGVTELLHGAGLLAGLAVSAA